jgi:N-acetylglutamate synthase-like GNAT family acetyltransferase
LFDDAINFRKANEMDCNAIWDLLHANGIAVQDEEILQYTNQIYVLEYQKRILGVLCGTYSGGQVNILWIAVHPLYPEHSLQEAMIQQFAGIFCRRPGDGMKRNPAFKWFRERPFQLFRINEGAIHGVQDQ